MLASNWGTRGTWVLAALLLACGTEESGGDSDPSAGGSSSGVGSDGSSGESATTGPGTTGPGSTTGPSSTTGQDSASGGTDGSGGDTDTPTATGCPADWQTSQPAWIFCDDFESGDPSVGPGQYFEYDDNDGDFVALDGVGYGGSRGMETHWQTGEVSAGSLKVGFGRNPNAYMNTGIRSDEDFREVYYRMMVRNGDGWTGSPAKLSRTTVFTSSDDWSQAMIAHLWSDDAEHLLIDPASCVQGGAVQCVGYNDFDNLQWLGNQSGTTEIFSTDLAGDWFCVEAHAQLNDPGQANGVQEFWIDGQLEARREGLDFVGTYADYGLNAVFFENYWNSGSVQDQFRYFDELVISTEPIGCPQ
jgi:hypothetical protein